MKLVKVMEDKDGEKECVMIGRNRKKSRKKGTDEGRMIEKGKKRGEKEKLQKSR